MNLQDEKEIALQALARGTPVEKVAIASKRGKRTIQKWKADNIERYNEIRNAYEKEQFKISLGLLEGDPDLEERQREIERANREHLEDLKKAKAIALRFFDAHHARLAKAKSEEEILEILSDIPTRQLSAFAKLLETTLNLERKIQYLDVDLGNVAAVAKKWGMLLYEVEGVKETP